MTTQEALTIHKYGALTSWKDLFYYQRHCNDPEQTYEIATWASRHNEGQKILLPLKDNVDPKVIEAVKIFS